MTSNQPKAILMHTFRNPIRSRSFLPRRKQAAVEPPQPAAVPFVADCAPSECESVNMVPGAVLALPAAAQELRVLAGDAWVTSGGHDIIVRAGEALALTDLQPDAIVSSAQAGSVELQLFFAPPQPAKPRTQTQEMRRAFYQRMSAHQQLIEVEARQSW